MYLCMYACTVYIRSGCRYPCLHECAYGWTNQYYIVLAGLTVEAYNTLSRRGAVTADGRAIQTYCKLYRPMLFNRMSVCQYACNLLLRVQIRHRFYHPCGEPLSVRHCLLCFCVGSTSVAAATHDGGR
jgi:hypothetical protein